MKWHYLMSIFILSLFASVVQAQESFLPTPSPTTSAPPVPPEDQEANDGSPYVYDPTGKKDPFKPYRAPRVRGQTSQALPIDPLLTLEVGQLEVMGIMWNTSQPRAVVQDTQQRSYTIFKNSRIGRNEGVVADIREGEVVIVEKFDDGLGNIIREAKVLTMRVKAKN